MNVMDMYERCVKWYYVYVVWKSNDHWVCYVYAWYDALVKRLGMNMEVGLYESIMENICMFIEYINSKWMNEWMNEWRFLYMLDVNI